MGAWDNAKKYVEGGNVKIEKNGELVVQGKKTELHQASVVGDTVGDPLKDTSGPALNIVMKLMAILSLVFSDFFVSINDGRGLLKMPTDLDLACPSTGCQCIKLVNMTTVVSDMSAGGGCM